MNWRRGLLLAGIHLAVAATLIVWQEVEAGQRYKSSKGYRERAVQLEARQKALQDEQTVSFDPCYAWMYIPPQERVVQIGELPAATLSGWGDGCPGSWSLHGILQQGPIKNTQRELVIVTAVFGALIPLQWLGIGGFPLIRPRRWWWEPGAFITVCTLAASVLLRIPWLHRSPEPLILFVELAWFYWFGLGVWKTLRSGWRLAVRALAHSH